MMLPNYVKFFRGTSEEFEKIKKDKDTLYFICDAGKTTGKLYLGNRLISGCGDEEITLDSITNVNIEKLLPDDVLSYNAETQEWTATSIESLLSKISFPDFGFTFDGGEET